MPAESTLERPLPNNLDAERSVLGAVLLDNNALNAAIENLRPEDFFLDQHRRVFLQMIALSEAQQAIDLITLTEELHRHGELESAGGAPFGCIAWIGFTSTHAISRRVRSTRSVSASISLSV